MVMPYAFLNVKQLKRPYWTLEVELIFYILCLSF